VTTRSIDDVESTLRIPEGDLTQRGDSISAAGSAFCALRPRPVGSYKLTPKLFVLRAGSWQVFK
jgi:hypothetical protein